MQRHLEEYDPCAQLSNVDAILEAYRSGQLEWSDRLVTYWYKGEMICGPVSFCWDELEVMSRNCGRMGFWVECVSYSRCSPRGVCLLTDFLWPDWGSGCAATPSEQNHSNRTTTHIPGKRYKCLLSYLTNQLTVVADSIRLRSGCPTGRHSKRFRSDGTAVQRICTASWMACTQLQESLVYLKRVQ